MKSLHLASAAAILATLAWVPAAAQQRSSTEWRTKKVDTRAFAQADALREFGDYSRCVVDRRYSGARSLVLAPYASPEQAVAATKIVRTDEDGCLRGGFDQLRMSFRPEVLAGGLAQALVLREYSDLPALIGSFTPTLEDERARAAQLNPAERFGRCLVYRDPQSVLTLIASRPATAEERLAIDALRADMGTCVAEGSTLRINETFVRNVTGVAAYRLAQQIEPRGPATAASRR